MAERREDPGQAVADDRRADVPDVHRLGDVGRGEVDDDRLRPARRGSGRGDRRPSSRPELAATQSSLRRTLRKPGPATSGGPAIGARSTAAATLCGQVAGLACQRLGQRHAAVGLIIAELGVGRRAGPPSRRPRRSPPRAVAAPKLARKSFEYVHRTGSILRFSADGWAACRRRRRRPRRSGSCQSRCGASPQISSSA